VNRSRSLPNGMGIVLGHGLDDVNLSQCWNYKVIGSQRRCLEGLIDDRDDADDEID